MSNIPRWRYWPVSTRQWRLLDPPDQAKWLEAMARERRLLFVPLAVIAGVTVLLLVLDHMV